MYIIENGVAYLIDNKNACEIGFDISKKMIINKKKSIKYVGQPIYTYDEVLKKLNINYNINAKISEITNKQDIKSAVKEYENKVSELTIANEEQKNVIDELNKQIEELKNASSNVKNDASVDTNNVPVANDDTSESKNEDSQNK